MRSRFPFRLMLAMLACSGAGMALSACNRRAEEPPPPANDRPVARRALQAADGTDPYAGATPVDQREAVLGLLNKRNGLVRDITLKPGESLRVGRAVVRLRNCERTAQWESPPEVGAFVQLLVLEHRDQQWHSVFSGWLFRERPDRNIIQHPIYDVFVRSCTMKWPGEVEVGAEDDGANAAAGDAASAAPRAASTRSSAPQSPAAAPAAPPARQTDEATTSPDSDNGDGDTAR